MEERGAVAGVNAIAVGKDTYSALLELKRRLEQVRKRTVDIDEVIRYLLDVYKGAYEGEFEDDGW